MSVVVIGAGSSGLAACRALAARGIPYTCFERGSQLGGLWRAGNDNGLISAYPSLSPNTSKSSMEFAEFPMPADWPDFPSHELVAAYLDAYADRYDLRKDIRFGVSVERVHRDGGRWSVTLDDGEIRTADAVWVASGGHHNEPDVPVLPGRFDGRALHSSEYRGPEDMAGERVLVVGLGASGADIASDASTVADHTMLAVRTGHYVVPKLVGGQPMDAVSSPLIARLPMAVRRPVYRFLLHTVNGRMSDYGLPEPPYKVGRAPVVPTSHLLSHIRHGKIEPRPAVAGLLPDGVRFADGTETRVDTIVWCTGFRLAFPFLDRALWGDGSACPELYLRALVPSAPGLAFIALAQPLGSTFPLAEAQARWLAGVHAGDVSLPSARRMRAHIRLAAHRQRRAFHDTSRGLLLEPHGYLRRLDRERRRRGTGAAGAPPADAPLTVPPVERAAAP